MATKTQFACDVCGKEKQSSNHWFCVENGASSIHVYRWAMIFELGGLEDYKHMCGEGCVIKYINGWMAGKP